MQKIDYNLKMKEIILNLGTNKKLLLHSCCAPCSSSVLERIAKHFDVTVVYYNPNIYPQEEYEKRKAEQIRYLKLLNIDFLDTDYDENDFLTKVEGLELEPEGGIRCNRCFFIRLEKIVKLAVENGFDYFGTTLTVSPHKNADTINKIGESLQEKYGLSFLYSDFKKEDGYLKSIKLSKEHNLYRQNYCGCRFSKN